MKRRRKLLCLALLLWPLLISAQATKTYYQYWFDNNKDEAIFGIADGEDISLSIDPALNAGIHFYNFRAYEYVGKKIKWGTVYRTLFYIPIPESVNTHGNLKSYEYWIDNDYSNRIRTAVSDDEKVIQLDINVNTLSPGVHFYNIRSIDSEGVWGTTYRYVFSIPYAQQSSPNKKITGYRYTFNDNNPVDVVFDTPVEEYTLSEQLEVPSVQPPMVIDDDCSFIFDDDENTATLIRNVDVTYSLYFKDEVDAICSPVTTNFTMKDELTETVQTIICPGTATIASHANGGFSVIRVDVDGTKKMRLLADRACNLRIYSPYCQLLCSYDALTLTAGVTREFEEGTYYAVVFGNTDVANLTINDVELSTPVIERDGNTIIITCAVEDATIYYTTDGTDPTVANTPYTGPFTVSSNCTIKAIAVKEGVQDSQVMTMNVNWFVVDDVTFVQEGSSLRLLSATMGATIYYNLDTNGWVVYGNELTMEGNHVVQAYAEKNGYTTSNVTNYQFKYERPVLAMPQITHDGNIITISCVTEGATIYYTTDGMMPTTSSTVYTGSFTVSNNRTIRAYAVKDGYIDSQVSSFVVDWIKECGYAVYDSSTGTLTFRYGLKPGGINVYEAEKTPFTLIHTLSRWNVTDLKTVIFEESFAKVHPKSTCCWFKDANQLTSIIGIEYLNTDEVTDMSWMFTNCWSLTSLDVSHFDTSKVTDMTFMFSGCSGLTSLDVSHFNTSKVTSMQFMFSSVRVKLNLSHFDTKNVTDMKGMFCGYGYESLDLSRFNTNKVQTMESMFLGTKLVTLDLSSFYTKPGPSMYEMFYNSSSLKTVYVGEDWSAERSRDFFMLYGCNNLVGEMGTKYCGSKFGRDWARIDGGTASPGYFTYKAPVQIKKGDVNDDGDVDIADAVCIVNHIVGKPNTTFVEAAADVNGDGDIDIADAVHIVNLVVGKITSLTPKFDFTLPEPQ